MASRLPEKSKFFTLKARDELALGLLGYLVERDKYKPTNELRLLVLNALSTLTLLEPKLDNKMRQGSYACAHALRCGASVRAYGTDDNGRGAGMHACMHPCLHCRGALRFTALHLS